MTDSPLDGPADVRDLSIDLSEHALDDRLARFTQLEELGLTDCPEVFELPRAVLGLMNLKELRLTSKRGLRTRVPTLVAELNLEVLSLDNVEVGSITWPVRAREVKLWSRQAPADLAVLAPRLAGVKVLYARAEGTAPTGTIWQVPAELGQATALEALELSDLEGELPATLGGLAHLRRLELTTKDVTTTVRQLAARFPALTELHLNASKAVGELPEELGALRHLEHLSVRYHPLSTLPASLSALTTLRTLQVQQFKDGVIPEGLCALRGLRSLQLGEVRAFPERFGELAELESLVVGSVNTLPPSFLSLTKLKRLILMGALNKGAMVSRFDSIDKLKPLPKVLGELTWLEELNLDQCGVFDLAPLRGLTALRRLSVSWSGLDRATDLAALTALEVLELEHNDRIKDLGPLTALTKLRELNLENCRPKSLDFLKGLPALKKLKISSLETKNLSAVYELDVELEADDEVLERFKQRAELRKLPPLEQLRAELASEDVTVVAKALEQLATWTIASSTRDANAIGVALGLVAPAAPAPEATDDGDSDDGDSDDGDSDDGDSDDGDSDDEDSDDEDSDDEDSDDEDSDDEGSDDEGARGQAVTGTALPPLDAALDRHGARLPASTLARAFAAVFQKMEEDRDAANRLAAEVAERGDDQAQLALVAAFVKASEYYDSGHRMWESTTQDVLIDDVFPKLGGAALTELLEQSNDGTLSEDGLHALFAPAFQRAGQAQLPALTKRLEKYATYKARYSKGTEVDELWASLAAVESPAGRQAVAAVQEKLAAQLAEKRARDALEAQLESKDPAQVTLGLKGVLALPEKADLPTGALWRVNACRGLDEDGLRLAAQAWERDDNDQGRSGLLALAADKGLEVAKRVATVFTGRSPAQLSELLRRAVADELKDLAGKSLRADWDDEMARAADEEGEHAPQPLPALALARSPRLDALRAWANELDGVDAAGGLEREAVAVLSRCGHFEREWLRAAIDAVALAPGPIALPPRAGRDESIPTKLAGDIGATADEESQWPRLRLLARHLTKLSLTGQPLERVLAQLLGICVRSDDAEGVRHVLALVPPVVTWDILSYNLACHFAVVGDKASLLRYTQRSLELGKAPAQFEADSDFAPYLEDPEFRATLATVA